MKRNTIIQGIETLLKEQNIEAYGYCSAAPFSGLESIYIERDLAGLACTLELREPLEGLIDPKRLLENAKSFLVILEPYTPYTYNETKYTGRMASGTATEDYHTVISGKLKPVQSYLDEQGYRSEIIVDTSPLSDRAIAVRSGLGIIRRNNMFYHKKYGSYIHIGALLTDIDIHSKDVKRISDPCGHCRRCVSACPGQAILGDGTIDSNKCVSFLTQKKTLNEQESKVIGRMIYGCDTCQRVCPVNQGIDNPVGKCIVQPDVEFSDLLGMSNKAFKDSFQKTSSGWRGKRTLQRNAIAAIGNLGMQEGLELLEASLKDQRPIIREEAERALNKIKKPR